MVCFERESEIVRAIRDACRYDVLAFKPGNVSIAAAGHDMAAKDFLVSADASAYALADRSKRVGESIHAAVAATHTRVGCNTNLGIILLAAPLAHAALRQASGETLHASLKNVLRQLNVDDARQCYAAIRIAAPAGLGSSEEHDVADAPDESLLAVMQFASVRDRIAYQYANDFSDIFALALPRLRALRERWGSLMWASVGLYLDLLCRYRDSHVERKLGHDQATQLQAEAQALERDFKACENPATLAMRLEDFDRKLKERGVNPGTTADLTVASVLALLLQHAWGMKD